MRVVIYALDLYSVRCYLQAACRCFARTLVVAIGATDSSDQSLTLLARQVPQKCRFGPTKKFRSFKVHFCPRPKFPMLLQQTSPRDKNHGASKVGTREEVRFV